MQKTLLGAGLFLSASFVPAVAADISFPVKAPIVTPVHAFSWTGFYVGANVGFGGDRFEYPFHAFSQQLQAEAPPLTSSTSGNFDLTSSGFFGGGQVGYNYQYSNNVVLGLEADFQWSGIKGRFEGNQILTNNGTSVSTTFGTGSEIAWFGIVRGRLGYAWIGYSSMRPAVRPMARSIPMEPSALPDRTARLGQRPLHRAARNGAGPRALALNTPSLRNGPSRPNISISTLEAGRCFPVRSTTSRTASPRMLESMSTPNFTP